MKKLNLLILALISLFLYNCSPEYIKNISNKKPKSLKAPVIVILDENYTGKLDAEFVGTIAIDNSGFVKDCSYDQVMTNIINETKRNGGNIIKINSQSKPSFFNSCHKIDASIYYSDNPRKYESQILWAFDRKLIADDFKMEVPSSKTHIGAAASFGIFYYIFQSNFFASTVIKVKAKFYCNKSWIKEASASDKSFMQLQQLHFDITELHARLLRKKLKQQELNFTTMDNAKEIYKSVMEQYNKMQKDCDEETEWGDNQKKLKSWQANIKDELYFLDEYKDIKIF